MKLSNFGNQTKANLLVIFILTILGAGLLFFKNGDKSLPSLPNIFAPSPTQVPNNGTKAGEARIYPDPKITPGKVYENVTKDDICASGYSARTRNVASSTKRQVYANYNTPYPKTQGEWEVDHFIPLGIGGSNDISNLWPEPANPKPGFQEKDVVENYLHTQICNGKIDIKEGQKMIQIDWYKVYLSIPKGFKL